MSRPARQNPKSKTQNPKPGCPAPGVLLQFSRGELSDAESDLIAEHLEACETCWRQVEGNPPEAALADDLKWVSELEEQTVVDVNVPLARLSKALPEYEIVREIGRGGMGIVFEARQVELDRRVALKVLPALLGAVRPDAIARFRREVKLAAGLEHTNIIGVYDFGEVDGTLYFTMPLIDGRSLREILHEIEETGAIDVVVGEGAREKDKAAEGRGDEDASRDAGESSSPRPQAARLPLTRLGSSSATDRAYYRRVAGWIADVAEALDYAHERGVIHRDVKPSNLLLARDGRLMISDFGLAKAAGVASRRGAASVTTSQALLGTARYMSPEQVGEAADGIDRRVDVYGLGATLYELLAFRPMFAAADDREVLDCVLNREPAPPRRFVRHVPSELETICLKAVEKRREARYATAKEFADDLRRWLLDLPIHARRPSMPVRVGKFVRRRKAVTALSTVAVTAVVAAIALLWGYQASQRKMVAAQDAANVRAADALFFEADAQFHRYGRYQTALAKVDEALHLTPDSPRLQQLRGSILRHMGRYDEAIECLEKLVERHPDYWLGHYVLSFAYDDVGDDESASKQRRQVERLNPDSAEALRVRADDEPDPEKALALLNRAIELDPGRPVLRLARYWRLRELGRLDEMMGDIQQVAGAFPNWAFVQSELGGALFKIGRYQEAEDAYNRAIELNPDDALAWFNRGTSKVMSGRFAQALADVTRSIEIDGAYAPAYLCRAKAQAGLGNTAAALEDCHQSIRLAPTSLEAYAQRCFLYHQAGRLDQVIADASRMIQLAPEDPRGYSNRAIGYMSLRQHDRAISDLTRYIELRPDDEKGYESRGSSYLQLGKYAEAIQDFTKGIELRPDVSTDYYNRSLCYRLIGRYDDAAADLTRILTLEPGNMTALVQRGAVYELAGDYERALVDYEQAASGGGPNEVYATLWRYALLRQLGQEREAAEVFAVLSAGAHVWAPGSSATETRSWTDRLVALYAGHVTAGDLLAASATDDERAEAHYYIGRKAQLDGDSAGARQAFEQCVALDRRGILETDFAQALLRELDVSDQQAGVTP